MSKPKALIVGDSISMGYTPLVAEKMAELAEVVHHEGNGGTSRNCREHLAEWVEAASPGVIHFNCGLHDIAVSFETKTHRVEIDEYEENLKAMVSWLKQNTDASPIWATTTPVIYERHHAVKGFDRDDKDVRAYNEVAGRIMKEAAVPINDLYAVIRKAGVEQSLSQDGVHMTDHGNAVLTAAVVEAIEKALRT